MQWINQVKNSICARPHFFSAIAIGCLSDVLLQTFNALPWATNLLISWNMSIAFYLIMVFKMMFQADHSAMMLRAEQQDESKWIIMLFVLMALIMCLVAIVMQLSAITKDTPFKIGHFALALLTLASAWLFMHTIFALHYAHDFYIARKHHRNDGLDFPQTKNPTYPDFVYFSYIIGTSAQTADVSITSRSMRLFNLLHAICAFGFNTVILAICINIAASLISG